MVRSPREEFMAELEIVPGSVHYRILVRLCEMPKPVRGVSGVMLNQEFHAPKAIEELARAGLIAARDWESMAHKMPPAIWVPTDKGEALYARLVKEAVES